MKKTIIVIMSILLMFAFTTNNSVSAMTEYDGNEQESVPRECPSLYAEIEEH